MIKLNEVNKKNRYVGCRGRVLGDPKAITLIALVITIVVLIILAGVAITLTLGENGIFKKAKSAKEYYINAADLEQQQLNEVGDFLEEKPKILKYDATKLNEKILLNNVDINDEGIVELSQSDSYVTIDEAFLPGNSTWEVVTKFKCASIPNRMAIIGKSGAHNPVYVMILNTNLTLYISSSDTSWNIANKSGTKTMQAETWYWIKLKFDGSSYQVLISENGENYDKDIEVVSSTITYQQDKFVLGENLYNPGNQKFYGQYDLKETYIKIGDNYFFNGLDYFSYQ